MNGHRKDRLFRAQWTVFGLSITAYMISFFHRVAPAALSLELQQALSATATELGSITAVFFLVIMLMQIPTGILADTAGPRKLLTLGCLVSAVGAFLFASAQNVFIASLARALIGFGAAIPFVALLRLNASWFSPHQFATLSGLTILLANLGSVLSTTPLQWLSQWTSWRILLAGVGAITLLTGLLIAVRVRDKPEDMGLPAPDDRATSVATPPAAAPDSSRENAGWKQLFRQVVSNPRTWPCFFVGFGICGTFFSFSSLWAVPYLVQRHGMNASEASTHVLLMVLAHAIAALILGRLSDRLRNRKTPLVILAYLYFLTWLPMTGSLNSFPGESQLVFIAQGVASTSYTLIWAVAKEVNTPKAAGMAIGVTNTSMFMATAILQPAMGALIDRDSLSGMDQALFLLGSVTVVGVIAGHFLTETHARNIAQ